MAMQKTLVSNYETPSWRHVNAAGLTLGRLASKIAHALQGKDKPDYSPFLNQGDFIVVTEASKMVIKNKDKTYYWHTGYPGGIKQESAEKRMARCPERVLMLAVRNMLPKGPRGRAMLRKLRVFSGADHHHAAQKPQEWVVKNDNDQNETK